MRDRDDPVTDLLKRARRRITDPDHWTARYAARSADGVPMSPTDDDAVAWCAVGSLRVEWGDDAAAQAVYGRAYNRLWVAAGGAPEALNDGLGHPAVLEMFDRAIRRK